MSATAMVACFDPDEVGLKETDSVQFALALKLEPQPFVSTKSSASAPANLTEVMLRLALPLFVSFTVWAAEVVPTV